MPAGRSVWLNSTSARNEILRRPTPAQVLVAFLGIRKFPNQSISRLHYERQRQPAFRSFAVVRASVWLDSATRNLIIGLRGSFVSDSRRRRPLYRHETSVMSRLSYD